MAGLFGGVFDPDPQKKEIDAAAEARRQEREAKERKRKGTLTIGDLARPEVKENVPAAMAEKDRRARGKAPSKEFFQAPSGLDEWMKAQNVPGVQSHTDLIDPVKQALAFEDIVPKVNLGTVTQQLQKKPGTLAHAMYLYDMAEFGSPTYGRATGDVAADRARRQFMSRVMDAGVVGDPLAQQENFQVAPTDLVTNLFETVKKKHGEAKAFEFLSAAGLIPEGRLATEALNGGETGGRRLVQGINPRTGKAESYVLEPDFDGPPAAFFKAQVDAENRSAFASSLASYHREATDAELDAAGVKGSERAIIRDNPGIGKQTGLDTYVQSVQGVVNPFTTMNQLQGRAVKDLPLAGRLAVTAGDFLFQIAVPIGTAGAAGRLGAKAIGSEGAAARLLGEVFTVDNLLDAPDLYFEIRDKGAFDGTVSFAAQMADQFNPVRLFDPNKSPEEKLITALSLVTYGGGLIMAKHANGKTIAEAAANVRMSDLSPDLQRQAKVLASVISNAAGGDPMAKAMGESVAKRMAAMAQAVAKDTGENAVDILKAATPTPDMVAEVKAAVRGAVADSVESRLTEAEAAPPGTDQGTAAIEATEPSDDEVLDLARRHAADMGASLPGVGQGTTFGDSYQLQQDSPQPKMFQASEPGAIYEWYDIDHSRTKSFVNGDVVGLDGNFEVWHGTDKTTGEPAVFLYIESGKFEGKAVKQPVVIVGDPELADEYDSSAGLTEGRIKDAIVGAENARVIRDLTAGQGPATHGEYEEAPVKKKLREHFSRVAASLDVPMDDKIIGSIANTNLSSYLQMTASQKSRQSHKDEIRRAIEVEYEMPRDFLKGKSPKQVMDEIDRTSASPALKKAKQAGKDEAKGNVLPWDREGIDRYEWSKQNSKDAWKIVGTRFTYEPMRGEPVAATVTGSLESPAGNLFEITTESGKRIDGLTLEDMVRRGFQWNPEKAPGSDAQKSTSKVDAMRARLEELRARPNGIKPKTKESGGTPLTKEDFEQLVLEVAVWAIDKGQSIADAIKTIAAKFDLSTADLRDIEDAVRDDYGDDIEAAAQTGTEPSGSGPASPERASVLSAAMLRAHVTGAQRAGHISEIIGENKEKFDDDASALDGLTPGQYEELVGMYARAVSAKTEYEALMSSIASDLGGDLEYGPIKRPARVVSKWLSKADADGDLAKVRDVLRATVIVRGVDNVLAAGQRLVDSGLVTVENGQRRYKDWYSNRQENYYAQILANLSVDGVTTEVQLNTHEMVEAKHKAHPAYVRYETARRDGAEAQDRGDLEMAENLFEMAITAEQEMIGIYRPVYELLVAGSDSLRKYASVDGTTIDEDSGSNSEPAGYGNSDPSRQTNSPAPGTDTNTSNSLAKNSDPSGNSTSETLRPSNNLGASTDNDAINSGKVADIAATARFEVMAGNPKVLDGKLYYPAVTRTGRYTAAQLDEIEKDIEQAMIRGETIVVDARIADQDAWKRIGTVPLRWAVRRVIVVDGGRIGKRILDSFGEGKPHPEKPWNMWRLSWDTETDVVVRLAAGQKMPTGKESVQSQQEQDGTKRDTQTGERGSGGETGVREAPGSRAEGPGVADEESVRKGRAANVQPDAERGQEPGGSPGPGEGVPERDGRELGDRLQERGGSPEPGDIGRGTGRAEVLRAEPRRTGPSRERPAEAPGDFRLTKKTVQSVVNKGKAAKLKALRAAVEARDAARERGYATADEQAAMAAFPGWGFDKNIFASGKDTFKKPDAVAVRSHMSRSELKGAVLASKNSHFTSPSVISAMWDAVKRMGFTGGRVLEPSAGSGLFYSLAPDFARDGDWTLIDKDATSGEILSFLFPESNVMTKGFEDAGIRESSQDLVISNVPFAEFGVFDAQITDAIPSDAPFLTSSVHNYFFARSVIALKPGGVAALITSRYTMDGVTPQHVALREWVDKHAEFLGAVRLPSTAFGESAETEVVTDIVFLRKRGHGQKESGKKWTKTSEIQTTTPNKYKSWMVDTNKFSVNEWYAKHPEMVLGKQGPYGTMYQKGEYGVIGELSEQALSDALKKIPRSVFAPVEGAAPTILGEIKETVPVPEGMAIGQIWREGDKFYENDPRSGKTEVTGIWGTGAKIVAANKKKFADYLKVRDALDAVMAAQAAGTDEDLSAAQAKLRKAHGDFMKAHGALTAFKIIRRKQLDENKKQVIDEETGEPVFDEYIQYLNEKLLWNDTRGPSVFAIEKTNPDTYEFEGLADVAHMRVMGKSGVIRHAENAKDALAMSLNERGGVDLEYMTGVSGILPDSLLESLRGEVFEVPEGGYADKSTYLSGNVAKKLAEARAAAEDDPRFEPNVKALEDAQPPRMAFEDIVVRLGSAFVPEIVYNSYMRDVLQARTGSAVKKVPGGFKVDAGFPTSIDLQFGAPGADAKKVFDAAINNHSIKVYHEDADGKRMLDKEASEAAMVKLDEMRDSFFGWMIGNPQAIKAVEDAYNEKVNIYQVPVYDGSGLTFPGLSNGVELRKHRVNAIDRAMRQPFTLWWHGVGSGKTFTAAMLAMKLRQTGLRKKVMMVTYKPTHFQIAREFLQAYPNAKILSAGEDSFSKGRREKFLAQIAAGDWDAVIVTQEQFAKLKLDPGAVEAFYDEEIQRAMEDAGITNKEEAAKSRDTDTKRIARVIARIEETKAKAVNEARENEGGITLPMTGIDHVIVDEAHFYKGLPIVSKSDIGQSVSARAMDMLLKAEHIRASAGGMTFMTGTALVNSFAEVHNWQRVLTPQALVDDGMREFDDWASNFAVTEGGFEVHVSGKQVWKERVRKFQNASTLAKQVSQTWDIVSTRDVGEIELPRLRDEEGNVTDKPIVVTVQPTLLQKLLFKEVAERYAAIDPRDPTGDNPLSISTLGRLVSQDPRLAAHLARTPFSVHDASSAGNKIGAIVENVARNYKEFKQDVATQLVFVDYGVPGKSGKYDFYAEITEQLVKAGITRGEIARITDAKNGIQKYKIAQQLRSGKIRVLIGSRPKLGVGMNVQDHLLAVHHLDLGWNPAMVDQGNGRIVRAYNKWTKRGGVKVYYYVTSGTYDEVTAQRTSGKANVFEQIMKVLSGVASGVKELDAVADSEGSASFAEIAMSASGDRRIMEMFTEFRALTKLKAASDAVGLRVQAARTRANGLRDREIPKLEKDVAKAKAIASHTDLSAPVLSMENEAVKQPEKFLNEALSAKAKEFAGSTFYSRATPVAQLFGGDWVLSVGYAHSSKTGSMAPMFKLNGPEGIVEELETLSIDEVGSSARSLLNWARRVADLASDAGQAEHWLDRARQDLSNYENAQHDEDQYAPQIPALARKVDRLAFETGITVAMLKGSGKEGLGGFGSEPLRHHDKDGLITVEGDDLTVLQENDKGDLWVRDASGNEFMVPRAVAGDWEQSAATDQNTYESDEGGKAYYIGQPMYGAESRFKDLASQLAKVAKGRGVQVKLESAGARRAMGAYLKSAKFPNGLVTLDSSLPPEVIAQVVSHEIGHAVAESSKGFDASGRWKSPTFAELFNVTPDEAAALKEEAKSLARILLGGELSAYNATRDELIARTIEAAVFAPQLLALHAPNLDAAVSGLAGRNQLLSDALEAAKAGIADNPTFMFLPDKRQGYIKNLGRYLGTRAWDNELAYRSRRIQAVEHAGRLIKDKMKGVKDDPSLLFKAAEGILANHQGSLTFGTKKFQTLDPSKSKYKHDVDAAKALGYRYGATKEDGTEIWVAWRVTPGEARRAFGSLSAEGKRVVLEFTSDAAEAADVFSREKLKAYAGIEANIQGWVHHFFEGGKNQKGGTSRLKKMTASTRRKRTGAEGYSTDFWAATLKSVSEVLVERVQNEFVTGQMAMVMEPLAQGEKAKPGWTEVSGDLVKGFWADGEKTYMVPSDGGFMPVKPGARYQVPTELWEGHLKRRSVAIESSEAAKAFDGLSKFWAVNMLAHPGTWMTNMVSGAIQFSAKVTADFYEGVLRGDLRPFAGDIVGLVETMTPRGWNRASDHIFGGTVGSYYQQFIDMDGFVPGAVDKAANKALFGMQQVERFWKKAIVNAEARGQGKLDLSDPAFIASVNAQIDLYAYDYSNIPAWLQSWRTNPYGRAIKPFMVYPYKYAKFLMANLGATFDVNLPWQTRVARVMSLATMLSAWMLLRKWRDDESETAQAVGALPEGVDADKLAGVVDARGRMMVGKDAEGRDVLVRTAKYPIANVADMLFEASTGDANSAGDILKDQIGSVGWLGEGTLALLGYSNEFSRYQDTQTRLTGMAAGFIPGSRVLKDVADALDPVYREYPKTPSGVLAQYVPLTDPVTMDAWRGAERTYKVPLPGGLRIGGRTTTDETAKKHQEDPVLRLLGGIVVKRVDPEWQRLFIDRAKENADEKAKNQAQVAAR